MIVSTVESGRALQSVERDSKFKLMLTAIEENSGHVIILANIEWGKSLFSDYDVTKGMHARIGLSRLKTFCRIKG